MNWHYSAIGLFVGFLVGLTGMGGGSLMTPILLFLHFKASTAVGSDLVYSAVMKLFGAAVHRKAGKVDMPLVMRLAMGSVPGSLLGAYFIHLLVGRYGDIAESFLTHFVGCMVLLVAITLLIRSSSRIRVLIPAPKIDLTRDQSLLAAVPIGLILGFLVGMSSVGSGAFFAVVFMLIFGLRGQAMVGTDIVHATILSAAAALGHMVTGDVSYGLVGNLLIGAIPGIILGSKLCAITPYQVLRSTLATILLISGLKVLVG